jgi:HK97 gp10 family phage protein
MEGLDGVLDTLRSLPPELVSKRGGPVRAALRKGAIVVQQAARERLRAVTVGTDSTGLTGDNIVVTRGKRPPPGGKGEVYLVRVRRKTYPGRKGAHTRKSAALLEYGSSQQRAEPWLRPAYRAAAPQALVTIETELTKAIARIVRKLAARNRGR